MNQQDLIRLGVPPGETMRRGVDFISRYILKGRDRAALPAAVEAVVSAPADHVKDPLAGEFAKALLRSPRIIRPASAPWRQWGQGLEPEAVNQLARACQLPVAVAGALMPDAHVGYGLPIGGVLATAGDVQKQVDLGRRQKRELLRRRRMKHAASIPHHLSRVKRTLDLGVVVADHLRGRRHIQAI